VDEHDRRALAADPVADVVAVELELLDADAWAARGSAIRAAHRICIPEIAREMTSRWISEVPSKIV
jgi:hypothetical protein